MITESTRPSRAVAVVVFTISRCPDTGIISRLGPIYPQSDDGSNASAMRRQRHYGGKFLLESAVFFSVVVVVFAGVVLDLGSCDFFHILIMLRFGFSSFQFIQENPNHTPRQLRRGPGASQGLPLSTGVFVPAEHHFPGEGLTDSFCFALQRAS